VTFIFILEHNELPLLRSSSWWTELLDPVIPCLRANLRRSSSEFALKTGGKERKGNGKFARALKIWRMEWNSGNPSRRKLISEWIIREHSVLWWHCTRANRIYITSERFIFFLLVRWNNTITRIILNEIVEFFHDFPRDLRLTYYVMYVREREREN